MFKSKIASDFRRADGQLKPQRDFHARTTGNAFLQLFQNEMPALAD